MNIFDLIFILSLVGLLLYKECQHAKTIKNILAAKLSENAQEIQSVINKKEEKQESGQAVDEIPLEDLDAEEMLKVLNKNK